MNILVLHGPNLNLLGEREPDIYGAFTLDEINARIGERASALNVDEVRYFQSNHEGELVDRLHHDRAWMHGAVFNPAAYTHTSIALRDAIAAIVPPVVEVHLSDVSKREAFRQTSYVQDVCLGTFS